MRYPIAIEPGDEGHAFGVVVPDLPGCFSAGDSLEEAMRNAEEAILLHLEGLIEAGTAPPPAGSVERHRRRRELRGWIWALVEVDLSKLSGRARRVNITLPERVLVIVDEAAAREGESRSGLLARAALEYVARRCAEEA